MAKLMEINIGCHPSSSQVGRQGQSGQTALIGEEKTIAIALGSITLLGRVCIDPAKAVSIVLCTPDH